MHDTKRTKALSATEFMKPKMPEYHLALFKIESCNVKERDAKRALWTNRLWIVRHFIFIPFLYRKINEHEHHKLARYDLDMHIFFFLYLHSTSNRLMHRFGPCSQSSRCVSHVSRGIRLPQSLIISSKKDETFDSVLFHISLLKCVECGAGL